MSQAYEGPVQYSFSEGAALDDTRRVALLGGKGAALARMTEMALPVPPGFTLTTASCRRVLDNGWFPALDQAIADGVASIESSLGRRFGDPMNPLLVSVRSGAPVSMPGMMDTVLNVGMTDEIAVALGEAAGDERFGWDTARRFLQSYVTVVGGGPAADVARWAEECVGADDGRELAIRELPSAVARFRALLSEGGFEVPSDPATQLREAVGAVFNSWDSERARVYRQVEGIDAGLGTAATVQAMTFGNLGAASGTGVAFTRDPSTGARGLVGDFLVGAQGEDVVAGTHATQPLSELRTVWPEIAAELEIAADKLERDLEDLADIEFTVENGVFWLLQVRRGKRSPRAALRIAIDLADDPTFALDRAGALDRVGPILDDPPTSSTPIDTEADDPAVLASGLPASPGRVVGTLCTDVDETIARAARGESVILVRRETSPADIAGMAEARGLVTTLGGLVSHAAVVARSWGLPAVVGVGAITVEPDGIVVGGLRIATGEEITVDGGLGTIMAGAHPGSEGELEEVRILRSWRDELSAAESPRRPERGVSGAETATTTSCCRVLALKGMSTVEGIADVLGCARADVESIVAGLVEQSQAEPTPGDRFRLLPEAKAQVDEQFRVDAARLTPVIEPEMEEFHRINLAFKEVVTAWQLREVDGESVPNDHDDADYDAAVIARLRADIHARIMPIVAAVAASEPRLARYGERLEAALVAIEAGDPQMVAHPLRDSYHTVWFELHEELIRLSGRNRADEAAAGRA